MKKYLFDRTYPLEERMVVFVYLTMILSSMAIVVINIAGGFPFVRNIKWICFGIFVFGIMLLYTQREKSRRKIKNISFIVTIYGIFPAMFIFSGGLRASAIPYMIIFLIAIVFSFYGRLRLVFVVSFIALAIGMMLLNFYVPDIFPVITDREMCIDWITNIPVILIIAAILSIWVSNEHRHERERAIGFSREMEQISKNDTLTGIFNRRYLRERVEELNEKTREVCLFIFDIDRFKGINDRKGHAEGDRILVSVARTMTEIFKGMTSIRFGGDEFLIIGGGCEKNEVSRKVEAFRKTLKDELDVTISGGVVTYSGNLEKSLIKADLLLYDAKNSGRDKVIIED